MNSVHYIIGVQIEEIMGITERRQKEKEEMKAAILKAAMQLFIEEGYDAVSIRKIAEKIEYSPSTIYLYFEDKDAIFYELHNVGFKKLQKFQMSVQNIEDPKERLIAHGRAYLNFALENVEYYDLMFIARAPGTKIVEHKNWDSGMEAFSILVKNVSECKNAGYFKNNDPYIISFVFWSMVHGMVSLNIRNRLDVFDHTEKKFDQKLFFEQALKVMNSFIR